MNLAIFGATGGTGRQLVRPSFLTDGPRTQQYQSSPDLRMQITSHISRANVADFMLQHITDTTSVRQALALTA